MLYWSVFQTVSGRWEIQAFQKLRLHWNLRTLEHYIQSMGDKFYSPASVFYQGKLFMLEHFYIKVVEEKELCSCIQTAMMTALCSGCVWIPLLIFILEKTLVFGSEVKNGMFAFLKLQRFDFIVLINSWGYKTAIFVLSVTIL